MPLVIERSSEMVDDVRSLVSLVNVSVVRIDRKVVVEVCE